MDLAQAKVGMKVRHRSHNQYSTPGVIKHIQGNMAVVYFSETNTHYWKISDLVSAEPAPKNTPFKPGWYGMSGYSGVVRPNTHYYYCYDLDGKIMYTNSYNPVTGEMDATWVAGLLYPRPLEGVTASGLTRLKMVAE